MRLSNKFTLAYVVLTFFVLCISFVISFQAFKHTSVQSSVGKLSTLNKELYKKLANTSIQNFDSITYHHTSIEVLDKADVKKEDVFQTRFYDESLYSNIDQIVVINYFPYKHKFLAIKSTLKISFAEDEYLIAIGMIFLWTFVFLITLAMVVGALVSIYLLDPFYKTLNNISLFKINNELELDFIDNSTYEFSQLNTFVKGMMDQAVSEYKSLKEFNENASHELQTPLAVMRSKIDLLLQTDLGLDQMKYIGEINEQIDKLSSIKKALTLLVHLDHYEAKIQSVCISDLLIEFLTDFEDILQFRNISLQTSIQENLEEIFDKELFQILMNNLISNALKYIEGDFIRVELNENFLKISNPGFAPTFDPNQYFIRFVKSSGKQFSSGIGLSIVKKVVDIHGYSVVYNYINGLHEITIDFK